MHQHGRASCIVDENFLYWVRLDLMQEVIMDEPVQMGNKGVSNFSLLYCQSSTDSMHEVKLLPDLHMSLGSNATNAYLYFAHWRIMLLPLDINLCWTKTCLLATSKGPDRRPRSLHMP